ncbi:hypothetical protein [Streptomyces sp. NPDC101393]
MNTTLNRTPDRGVRFRAYNGPVTTKTVPTHRINAQPTTAAEAVGR